MVAWFTVRRAVLGCGLVVLACVVLLQAVGSSGAGAPPAPDAVDVSPADRHARDVQIAVDARGTAIAMWIAEGDTESIVHSAVRPAGGTWGAPSAVSAAGERASGLHLAANARGRVVAVWERFRDGNYVVQGAVRAAGGSWGAVSDLSVAGRACRPGGDCVPVLAQRVARMLLPRVAIDGQGNAVAIWERFVGHSSRLQAAFRPVGGRWRVAVDVARFAKVRSQDFAFPQIALRARGEAVAIWTRLRRSGAVIQAAVRRAGSRWRAPVNVSARGRYAGGAQVALDRRGHALAIWELTPSGRGEKSRVQSATRAASGRWSPPIDLSAAGADAGSAKLAAGQRGAVVVWSLHPGGAATVLQSADRPVGAGWRRPVDITQAPYAAADVAVDARGNAVAAWALGLPNPSEDDDPLSLVQGAVRPAGGMWQPRSLGGPDMVHGSVRVAIDPRGELAAIWPRVGPRGVIVARAAMP